MRESGVEIYSYLIGNLRKQPAEKKEEAAEKKAAGFYKRENEKITLKSLMEMMEDGAK